MATQLKKLSRRRFFKTIFDLDFFINSRKDHSLKYSTIFNLKKYM